MYKRIFGSVRSFARRTAEDHLGAYAATGAFFLMLSFVPFVMILLAIARLLPINITSVMNTLISIMPAGLRDYASNIVEEVYTKSYAIVPISVFILIWSASKFFHAMTNGLNVISQVKETRNWFATRLRSMLLVTIFIFAIVLVLLIGTSGENVSAAFEESLPVLYYIIEFFMPFRRLIGYFALILIFLFLYKFLPNRYYTFRSQLPGALIVSTVWIMFSYFISLYYTHNGSFQSIYGNLTGMVLAMIWLFFCMYFVLVGAELNRIIYEDPEGNVIVQTIQDVKESAALRKEALQLEKERQRMAITGELPNDDLPLPGPGRTDEDEDSLGPDLELIRKEVDERNKGLMEEQDE